MRLAFLLVLVPLAACATTSRTSYFATYDRPPSTIALVAMRTVAESYSIDAAAAKASTLSRAAVASVQTAAVPLEPGSSSSMIFVISIVVDRYLNTGGSIKSEIRVFVDPKLVRDGNLRPDSEVPPAEIDRAAQLLTAIRQAEEPYLAPP